MKVLGAVKSHLFLGQLTLGPQFEKRMIFTVFFVARGDQLIVERIAHSLPPINRRSKRFEPF
jgi:hypothetical protein